MSDAFALSWLLPCFLSLLWFVHNAASVLGHLPYGNLRNSTHSEYVVLTLTVIHSELSTKRGTKLSWWRYWFMHHFRSVSELHTYRLLPVPRKSMSASVFAHLRLIPHIEPGSNEWYPCSLRLRRQLLNYSFHGMDILGIPGVGYTICGRCRAVNLHPSEKFHPPPAYSAKFRGG